MPKYRVIGRVAPLDQPDSLGRVIVAAGLDISEVPIPLMFLKGEPTSSHHGVEIAGRLTRLTITDDGQLEVEGETQELEPGCYSCGVFIDQLVVEDDGSDEPGPSRFTHSRLRGVTAYDNTTNAVGSFTNAHLHVEMFPTVESGTHWFCQACFAEGPGEAPRPCPSCKGDDVLTFDPAEA